MSLAIMTALAADVRRQTDLPMGINVLRNDGRSALAIAHAIGAQFIRVNVLCGARVTDQGIVSGIAHDLLRDRAMLRADVAILADVDVKHSAPIAPRPLVDEVGDTLERGLADALIVSGAGTGKRTDLSQVREVKAAAGSAPVLIGSGADPESIPGYLPYCDGFIVGNMDQDTRSRRSGESQTSRERSGEDNELMGRLPYLPIMPMYFPPTLSRRVQSIACASSWTRAESQSRFASRRSRKIFLQTLMQTGGSPRKFAAATSSSDSARSIFVRLTWQIMFVAAPS